MRKESVLVLTRGTLLFIANLVTRLVTFSANFLAARLLGTEGFGQYGLLRQAAGMFDSFTSGSIGNVSLKMISESYVLKDKKTGSLIVASLSLNAIIALILGFAVFLNQDLILDSFFLGNTSLRFALYLTLLLVVTSVLSSQIQKILIGMTLYKSTALTNILVSILAIPFIYILIIYGGLEGAITAIAVFFFVLGFIQFIVVVRKLHEPLKGVFTRHNLSLVAIIMKKSAPLFICYFVMTLCFWLMRSIIVYRSQSFSFLGIFEAAYLWMTLVLLVTGATTSVFLQMLSEVREEGDKRGIGLFWLNLKVNMVIVLLFSLPLLICPHALMSIYGAEYTRGAYLLPMFIPVIIFTVTASLMEKLLISEARERTILGSVLLSSLLALSFMVFIPMTDIALQMVFGLLTYYLSNILLMFAGIARGPKKGRLKN